MDIKKIIAGLVLVAATASASAGVTILIGPTPQRPHNYFFFSDQPQPQVLIQQAPQGFWRRFFIDQFGQRCDDVSPTVYGHRPRCANTGNVIVGERLEFVPY